MTRRALAAAVAACLATTMAAHAATGDSLVGYGLSAVTAAGPDDVWAFGNEIGNGKTAVFLHRVAHSWRAIPPLTLHGQPPFVASATAISPDDVWAVGEFPSPAGGNASAPFALHWDGSGWHGIPVPFPMDPRSRQKFGYLTKVVANSSNDVWTFGDYVTQSTGGPILLHWNGSVWSQVPMPPDPGQNSFANTIAANGPGSIKVFGGMREPDGGYVPLIEQYVGGTWTTLPSLAKPGPHSWITLNFAAQVAPGDIWAIGTARYVRVNHSLFLADGFAENWLGTTGTAHNLLDTVFAKLSDPTVTGIAGSAANDVWTFAATYPGQGRHVSVATHWTGRHWSPLMRVPQQGGVKDSDVSDMAVLGPNDAWAVGTLFTNSDVFVGMLAHWDGTAWTLSRLP